MIALAVRALAVAALAAAAAGQTVYPAGATVIVPPGPIAPVPFTPGNIVVARLGFWNGTGWAPLSTIGGGARAAPYYLDELKCVGVDATGARNAYPGGTPCTTVQTIGLPTTTIYGPGGVVTQYTCTGTYDFVEGQLTLSENSQLCVVE